MTTHHQLNMNIDTSEDNTTRYWREQQARDKLQKKQNNGLTNIKSKLLQQTQVDDAPCEVKEF
jgi:hypothetical protein